MDSPPPPARRRPSDKQLRRAERRAKLRAWRAGRRAPPLEAKLFVAPDEPPALEPFLAELTDRRGDLPMSLSMRRVHDVLLRLIRSAPGLFLVTGDAGVGKSVFALRLAIDLEAA